IHYSGADLVVQNCVFDSNVGSRYGAVSGIGYATIQNSVFFNNSSASSGATGFRSTGGRLILQNNIVWGVPEGMPVFSYLATQNVPVWEVGQNNIIQGGFVTDASDPEFAVDENNRDIDPLFVDPENGDFRLRPESPAIGMGTDQLPPFITDWPSG